MRKKNQTTIKVGHVGWFSCCFLDIIFKILKYFYFDRSSIDLAVDELYMHFFVILQQEFKE